MRAQLERIFRAGLRSVMPAIVLPPHLVDLAGERLIVLAVGKAAGGMAAAVEARFGARAEGVAIVPHGSSAKLEHIGLRHAGHPLPDEASLEAAEHLLKLAGEARAADQVLVLLSGGASALACAPGDGLTIEAKQAVTEALLRSGATIGEINIVRRHLSRIKGGRLARAAAPARLLTLAISDVVGDRPEDIGSGPTAGDPTTIAAAEAVLERYGIDPPIAGWGETPGHVDGDYRIVAGNFDALAAAAKEARRLGYRPQLIQSSVGEARDVGRAHAELVLSLPPGTALISGGELTVTVRGTVRGGGRGGGRGGPNQEYALAAAIRLAGRTGIAGLAADTDGSDGSGPAAGAFFDGESTYRRARDAEAMLEANDSGTFFAALNALLVTGPTGTNVNDLRIILTAP